MPLRSGLPLHRVALEEARRILRAGAHAVAVTGSVGRGNPSQDSDVDLWVLWDRNQRRHFQRGNVWVTHLIQTPEEAFSLDNLCLWDVEDLWVVADPEGLFAVIRRRYREAVVTVRRLLALDLLPHALAEANVWDPHELPAWPVASVFAAAHGVPWDPNALAPAHATARAVAALCRALGTGRHVPRRVGFDAALKHATRAR